MVDEAEHRAAVVERARSLGVDVPKKTGHAIVAHRGPLPERAVDLAGWDGDPETGRCWLACVERLAPLIRAGSLAVRRRAPDDRTVRAWLAGRFGYAGVDDLVVVAVVVRRPPCDYMHLRSVEALVRELLPDTGHDGPTGRAGHRLDVAAAAASD